MKDYVKDQIKQFNSGRKEYIQSSIPNRYRIRHFNDNNNYYNIHIKSMDASINCNFVCNKESTVKDLLAIIDNNSDLKETITYDLYQKGCESALNLNYYLRKLKSIFNHNHDQYCFIMQKKKKTSLDLMDDLLNNNIANKDSSVIDINNKTFNKKIKSEIAFDKEKYNRYTKHKDRLQLLYSKKEQDKITAYYEEEYGDEYFDNDYGYVYYHEYD